MYQAGGRPHLSSRQPKSKDFGKRSTSTGSSKNDGSIREVPRLPAVLGGSHPRAGLLPRAGAPPFRGPHSRGGTKDAQRARRPPPPPPPRPPPPPPRLPPPARRPAPAVSGTTLPRENQARRADLPRRRLAH